MSELLTFLTKNNYKPLEKDKFKEKVKEYCGVSKFEDGKDELYFSHPKGYDINLKNQFINIYEVELNFIMEMRILEKGIDDIYNNRFVCYNKIIFNDDISSVTQILHDSKAVEDVVIYFDYEKNTMLVNFALNNIDINNEEIIYLEHIIFYNDKSKEDFIKKKLLFKILEKNESFFIKLIQNLIEFWYDFRGSNSHKYQALAYMFETLLNKYHKEEYEINNIAFIILNNAYVEREEVFQNFSTNNYYRYDLLKEYSRFFILLNEE